MSGETPAHHGALAEKRSPWPQSGSLCRFFVNFHQPMAPDSTVRWPVFLPLVLFFGGIGAAAAMTQLLGSF